MAKLSFLLFLVLLAVSAMLFSAVEARKLNHLKDAGFVAMTFQLSKMFEPSDKCYANQKQCKNTVPACDDPDCKCATEVNENFPAVCIERNCVGRHCEEDSDCWSSACKCGADSTCELAAPGSDDDVVDSQNFDETDQEQTTDVETIYDDISDR